MDRFEEDMFDDLAMDEAEGAADGFDAYDAGDEFDAGDEADGFDGADEADGFDGYDEFDAADAGDEFDSYDEADGFDTADGFDGFEEGDEGDEEDIDRMLAFALGAEDSDEFFRRIARTLSRVGGAVARGVARAAPVVGQIARTVAPVAGLIPGVGAIAGPVANVLGQLLADEASEEEALDAFAELSVRERRAVPVVAALAARTILGPRAANLPPAVRRQAVQTIRAAATQLVNRGGPGAIRALPRIARSVRRTAVARRTPVQMRPQVLANTVRRVARQNPQLRHRLVRPSPTGRRVIQRVGQAVRAGRPPAAVVRRVIGGAGGAGLSHHGGGYGGTAGTATAGHGTRHHRGRRITIRGPVTIVIRR
ncbi:MAG: hypothetical protein A4S16_05310 [Proteobacteria bacterium SG_bin6]|nr:MAG: hypothetical protein A4S16_05310 [Proteobacteria bacterium SG_bin6]